MSTSIGFVIRSGEAIPADVTEVHDRHGDRWIQLLDRTWRCVEVRGVPWDGTPVSWRVISGTHGPLTATAVREQPAEPAPQPTPCPDRKPHEPHTHSGFARPEGVPPAWCPGLPDESVPDVLDLVRQYGRECVATYPNGQSDAARALLDRIAALIPQQPVQARNMYGSTIWWHPCGFATSDQNHHEQVCRHPGPWRPLLVVGDPAPEVEESREIEHYRQQVTATLNDVLRERDEARAEIERLTIERDAIVAHANHWEAEARALKEAQLAEPGPLRLSLPQVPPGTAALIGEESKDRYEPHRGRVLRPRWVLAGGSQVRGLGALLDAEGSVTVELTPPREPRTWPKLDDAPADLRAVRGASERVYRPYDDGADACWYYVDAEHGKLGFESFAEIAYQDGPLTEVFDDEAGTR